MKIDLSIVIPVGSIDTYLLQAERSVKRWGGGELSIEVILVFDDQEAKERYRRVTDRVSKHVYANRTDQKGPGICRNIGIQKSSGDYILFLDADDLIEAVSLEMALIRARLADADIAEFNYALINEYGKTISGAVRDEEFKNAQKSRLDRSKRLLMGELRDEAILQLYKTAFLRSSGALFKEGIYEDIEFRYKTLIEAARVIDIDEVCYKKRVHGNSITASNSMPRNRVAYMQALAELRKSGLSKDSEQALLYRVAGFLGLLAKEIMCAKDADLQLKQEFRTIYREWGLEEYLRGKGEEHLSPREKLCEQARVLLENRECNNP